MRSQRTHSTASLLHGTEKINNEEIRNKKPVGMKYFIYIRINILMEAVAAVMIMVDDVLPRDAMHSADSMVSQDVYLSVRPSSVRLSHAGIVPKQVNIS